MILVSACLLGHKVKYSGGSNSDDLLLKYNSRGRFIAICPECFGMLPVPRPPVEIQGGSGKQVLRGKMRVKDPQGRDATAAILAGAQKALAIARAYNVKVAILKDGSPSCGVHRVYDGTFAHKIVKNPGVAAALLMQNGITIYSEKDMTVGRLEELIAEDIRRGN